MKTSTSLAIAALIIGFGYFVTRDTTPVVIKNPTMNFPDGYKAPVVKNNGAKSDTNSFIKDGVQYVTITANGGYKPRQSIAKAGVPTKILMKTDGTYDCSSSLVIRSLNYRGMLPNTGETIIDAKTPKAGDIIQGVCGMGMYSFTVEFK